MLNYFANLFSRLGWGKKTTKPKHLVFGQAGEDLACQELKKAGYKIVERNWRKNKFEIDIIAKDQDYLVFVEVRARQKQSMQSPEQSFLGKKQKQIYKAAQYYMLSHNYDAAYRFDFVAVEEELGKLSAEIYQDV